MFKEFNNFNKVVNSLKNKQQSKILPGQEHKQKHQVHVFDVQAALKDLRRTSQLYDNREHNLYPVPCENV